MMNKKSTIKKIQQNSVGSNPPSLKLSCLPAGRRRTRKGFSIGEVMIAMFILVFGIIGAVFLSAKSTAQIGDSRNAIIAASLAQEGVELVRNVRDNSVTQETCGVGGNDRCTAFDPDTTYKWPTYSGAECAVDYVFGAATGEIMDCSNISGLQQLYLNPSTGSYEHSGGGDEITSFKRVVFINYYDVEDGTEFAAGSVPLNDTVEAKITSVVTWGADADNTRPLNNVDEVEANCKIGKQCAYAQTTLTSWINYGE